MYGDTIVANAIYIPNRMKPKEKDYSWLLIIIVLGLALLGAIGCKSPHAIDHKDSTECAVFEGWPVIHDTEFEIEAVFVPVENLSLYDKGDVVYIDNDGFIIQPLRDAETNQFITDGLQKVVIHDRILPNKFQLIKQL